MFYQLIHVHYAPEQENGGYYSLGFFKSVEACRATIAAAKNNPGYKDYPNNFFIIPVVQSELDLNIPVFAAYVHFYDDEFHFEEWFTVGYSNREAELQAVMMEFEEANNMQPLQLNAETLVENILMDRRFCVEGFRYDTE